MQARPCRERLTRAWLAAADPRGVRRGRAVVVTAGGSKGTDLRTGDRTSVTDVIAREQLSVTRLGAQAEVLRAEIDQMSARVARTDKRLADARSVIDATAPAAGMRPVTGPGVTVLLDDAPTPPPGEPMPQGLNVDSYCRAPAGRAGRGSTRCGPRGRVDDAHGPAGDLDQCGPLRRQPADPAGAHLPAALQDHRESATSSGCWPPSPPPRPVRNYLDYVPLIGLATRCGRGQDHHARLRRTPRPVLCQGALVSVVRSITRGWASCDHRGPRFDLLFCAYQLFWTNVTADRAADQVVSQLVSSGPNGVGAGPRPPARPPRGPPQVPLGDALALCAHPALGPGWVSLWCRASSCPTWPAAGPLPQDRAPR